MSPDHRSPLQPDDEVECWVPARLGRFVPGIAPIEVVLARNDAAALAISFFAVTPDSLTFTLTVCTSEPLERCLPRRASRRMGGLRYAEHQHADDDERDIFFGVEFPDGATVTSVRPYFPRDALPTHGLDLNGGTGTDTRFEHELVLWPLPGPGVLDVVVAWPEMHIEETHCAIDTTVILDAAQRARPMWPEDAGLPAHPSFEHGHWHNPRND